MALAVLAVASCAPAVQLPAHGPLGAVPTALLTGRLTASGPCVYVEGVQQDRWLVIWPTGYQLVGDALVSGDRRVASLGDTVRLGGGEWPEGEFDSLRRLLVVPVPDACRGGDYWLSSGVLSGAP